MVQRSGIMLKCGDVAKATGVSVDTIRHYERLGILPRASRTDSGYRVFPQSAVDRVLVVQRSLRIGFTLAELAEVLKARDTGQTPCGRVYQLAQEKLEGIAADIKALKQAERQLKKVKGPSRPRQQVRSASALVLKPHFWIRRACFTVMGTT